MRSPRASGRAGALAAAALLVVAGAAPGRAQEPPAPAPLAPGSAEAADATAAEAAAEATDGEPGGLPVRLQLAAVTAVVGAPPRPAAPSLRVVLEHRGDEALDGVELVATLHAPVVERAALDAALAGEVVGAVLATQRAPVGAAGTLAPEALRVVDVALAEGALPAATADAVAVHPLRLELRAGREVVGVLTTAIVRVTAEPTTRLLTTVVVPWTDTPWRGRSGAYASGVAAAVRDGGHLEELLRGLERRPEARVVLAPGAHVLEDLADRADGFLLDDRTSPDVEAPPSSGLVRVGADDAAALRSGAALERLRRLVTTMPVAPLTLPYADADLTALRRAGPPLSDLAAEAAVEGTRRAQRLLGTRVEPATLLTVRQDPSVLDLVGGQVVVLPADAVTDASTDVVRTLRAPSGRILSAVVGDAGIAALLAGDAAAVAARGGPIAAAQAVLAASAVASLAAPDGDRVLAVVPPDGWAPSAPLVAELIGRLDAAPWLQLEAPATLAARGRRVPATLAAADTDGFPERLRETLRSALVEVAALEGALPDTDTAPDGRTPAQLRDQLLRAAARPRPSAADASTPSAGTATAGRSDQQALVDDVLATTADAFGTVVLGAGDVTLTARDGSVPVSLSRPEGPPLAVVVEVRGTAALRWPDGTRSEEVLLEPGVERTVVLATTSVSTGTSPVTVRVLTPDGSRELASAVVSVRATAASRPALVAITAVVVALLVVGRLRGRRRSVAPPPPAPPGTGGQGGLGLGAVEGT